jgi:ribA/ribD-fused uncharacterized protein
LEHAYQAAKTLDPKLRRPFQRVLKAGQAKHMGRELVLRPDWENVKEQIMLDLLRQKFKDRELSLLLRQTENRELIEGNNWHDTFWGVCNGKCWRGPHEPVGENKLGKLLMQVRDECKKPSSLF